MSLNAGSKNADTGMSLEIYKKLDLYLSPSLQDAVNKAEGKAKTVAQTALNEARKGWQRLAYSIAFGVIEHIKSNMEIKGITGKGDVDTTVMGETKTAIPDDHSHEVDLPVKQENVVFTQDNDGTGHVQ